MPPKIGRKRKRKLYSAHDLKRGQAHSPAGIDHLAIDLPHADVGVGEDRRNREQHKRERHVGEADADVGDEERDQREARDGAADVRDADRDELALPV